MSLDYPGRCLVTRLLQKRVARGKTVIMITHDMDWLAENCQDVYAMSQGCLVYQGPFTSSLVTGQCWTGWAFCRPRAGSSAS